MNGTRKFALCAVLAVLASVPAAAGPMADPNCKLSTPVEEVATLGELPLEIRKLIGPIAEKNAPFNKTDAVEDGSLPFKRLLRAGHHGDTWFVWYEHGGITYFWHAAVIRVASGGGETKVLMNAGTILDMLCLLTDGAFAGSVPPYPPSTWAQSYF